MENHLSEDVIISWYDWNDGSHIKSAANYTIRTGDHETINALHNVVIQISVYKTNNEPLLDGIWMNFYATKRNMKIVNENGVTSIQYTS